MRETRAIIGDVEQYGCPMLLKFKPKEKSASQWDKIYFDARLLVLIYPVSICDPLSCNVYDTFAFYNFSFPPGNFEVLLNRSIGGTDFSDTQRSIG